MLDAPAVPSPSEAMLPVPYRIEAMKAETADTMTLIMVPADGARCPSFLPAQIGMIGIPGLGEVPISYSGDPRDTSRLDMTIRAAGAITSALTDLGPGDIVSMRGPYGRPWPIPVHGGLVIVVGGLGLAPLRSAVLEARQRDVDVRLVYGARSPHDLMFADDLAAWASEFDVFVVVERPSDTWAGRVGLVSAALDDAFVSLDDPSVFMCGPDPMMAAVGPQIVERHVDPDRLWVTMERNMKCSIGLCGHCQFGRFFVCKDGPVFSWDQVGRLFGVKEL